MKKTVARVEFRILVPYFISSYEFWKLTFSGFRAEEMKEKWIKVKEEKINNLQKLYAENSMVIDAIDRHIRSVYQKIEKNRPFYRFWYNKSEQRQIFAAESLKTTAFLLEKQNDQILRNGFYRDVTECLEIVNEFLKQNGFLLSNNSTHNTQLMSKTDFWELEE